ncbi:MAG: extracellular solute-binding protein [Candidatus Moranbacteria bacterium]|nr:extracellular solute-binding protein [Candidatus Moranbacteria bacterium]
MKFSRIAPFVVIPLLALSLSGCGDEKPVPYSVDLEVWGVFDDSAAYSDVFRAYRELNESHIGNISYRKMSEDTYRDDLIRAFAEGKGPDIFMIRNSWLPLFENLIAPAPDYQTNEKEFREAFVDVAADDSIVDGKIYAAPLSVDSLALYYNKDIFDAAGITSPPATWDELLLDTKLLNQVDPYGNITQSGVALGTAKNINRSTDILLAIALQRGLEIRPDTFRNEMRISDESVSKSLDFYAQFGRVGSEYYSWNPRQHYSLDAFYEGTLGMMINYSWHADTIRKKNAKLDFAVAPLPQTSGTQPSNYANYWTFVVAKNKQEPTILFDEKPSFPAGRYNLIRIHESWQFLHYLVFPHLSKTITLRNPLSPNLSANIPVGVDPASMYLEVTKKPAARRDLVEKQKNDQWLSPFSYGNLIAKSWRPGDIEKAEGILAEAMDAVSRGENTPQDALQATENQIGLLK